MHITVTVYAQHSIITCIECHRVAQPIYAVLKKKFSKKKRLRPSNLLILPSPPHRVGQDDPPQYFGQLLAAQQRLHHTQRSEAQEEAQTKDQLCLTGGHLLCQPHSEGDAKGECTHGAECSPSPVPRPLSISFPGHAADTVWPGNEAKCSPNCPPSDGGVGGERERKLAKRWSLLQLQAHLAERC